MKRNQMQEDAAPVTVVKQVVVHSEKPANTALALLKPSTTEVVFKNQWLPHCSEGAESRSKVHEIYQVKPSPGTSSSSPFVALEWHIQLRITSTSS